MLKGATVAGDRCIQLALLAQRDTQVVEGRNVAWRQGQSLVVSGDRSLQVAFVLGFNCGIKERLGISGDLCTPFRQFWLFRHNTCPRILNSYDVALCARYPCKNQASSTSQSLAFDPNAVPEQKSVENREYHGNFHRAEDQRQDGNFSNDNHVVGVAEPAIWPN